MEMRKCDKGHYYDASLHSECPYCKNNMVGSTVGATVGMTATATVGENNVTRPLFEAVANSDGDDNRTVALIQTNIGIDPVVGWLVCIRGSEKGRDFRIHTDNNYIGRSDKMDICIRGDETISRENQAIITYDSPEKSYLFSPGDGRSIVRINGKSIFQTTEVKAYDVITIGKTDLLFIPLCGEKFEWEKE